MELTGKCKEAFEKWYFKKHCSTKMKYKELLPEHRQDVYGWFYGISLSFKFGVYQDFFDSVGIYIQVLLCDFEYKEWQASLTCEYDAYDEDIHDLESRQEARKSAIEKANEIFNNQKQ